MKSSFVLAILALAVSSSLAWAQDADPAKGANQFKKCMACHDIDQGINKIGPTLKGVVGRKAGEEANYSYSDAFKAKVAGGLVWDDANLTTWITAPQTFIPGTKMAFAGIKKPQDVANLIAFLKSKQ